MMDLVFATGNQNKVREVQILLPEGIRLRGLKDIGCDEELPETHRTIEANSQEKAEYVWMKYGLDCFAEDTGLEVVALDGAPGVDTAIYAGTRDSRANMGLLLLNLRNEKDRRAQFRTVFTLILGGNIHQFTGIVTGQIALQPTGEQGFGYDPVFIPDGYSQTFAELDLSVKTIMSHRAKAFNAMTNFLKELF